MPVLLFAELGRAAHPVQVGAGAEGTALARQHRDARRAVGADRLEGLVQRGDDLLVEGVVHLGPPECDGGDSFVTGELDVLGSHGYMRKTPKLVSGIGAFREALMPSARTVRVSSGSMMPSSHRRAVL